ncbi:RagB/SusD family nutrient uptake outer membrane protein [Sphingobacterium sp. DK4209]|uniref:RagB/SusD family nutrient uptake outer membrane protein n=1 Tax=Sphingobacterium zhuxiongii TaxID=2662364 RepID=A0A5Q0Q689_9SPHI|nr:MULTISPECIES: RagB/SusD family nutrient uptake outer membrane protein [unclassified Sphingobacterium]MVZ66259.1 RagB/SusD family nutrient uptake outer membrane protein [Sphingobacterium sp. DK4209]QGA24983.1 RagB/SusD family nutrient uptake outer membrane protein [Sphingobacterium sp. dk4302]
MKRYIKNTIWGSMLILSVTSCSEDLLNLSPKNDITADQVYSTEQGYRESFLKVYGSLSMTSGGGEGASDLAGIDAGQSDFFRLYWNIQQLTSDETLCGWNDPGVPDMVYGMPDADNIMVKGLYTRCIYTITVANEFLRESTPEKLSARGIGNTAEIDAYRSEARFVRAYQYWVLLDLFGNPPFVTEDNLIGKVAPEQIQRADLFKYIEKELLEIEPLIKAAKQNEYGRADQGAVWTLLTRLYLNANVYTGAAKYTEAITYANKVINGGYALTSNYANLFLEDNNVTSKNEIIFSINYDGVKTRNYGGTTFLINSLINGEMTPVNYGVPTGGWGGNRSTKAVPTAFPDYSGKTDKRAMFFGDKLENDELGEFKDGLRVTKFKNVKSNGTPGASQGGTFSSLDFPLFRLADVYLMYAEAVLRGGTGGSTAQALGYFNQIRTRAYGNATGNASAITLDDILNERMRELYFEGYRRTDLIRFGKFTGSNYIWPWKGGVKDGRSIESFRALLPLPSSDVIANTNLTQNQGY